MTITDCLGARQLGRFAHTIEATLDAPAKRTDVLEPVASTRMLRIADLLRAPSAETIDVHGATYDLAA